MKKEEIVAACNLHECFLEIEYTEKYVSCFHLLEAALQYSI